MQLFQTNFPEIKDITMTWSHAFVGNTLFKMFETHTQTELPKLPQQDWWSELIGLPYE